MLAIVQFDAGSTRIGTNLIVNLPIDSYVPISCVCIGAQKIWIGTGGAGLVEYDKDSRKCRRLTQADGLMLDNVTDLHQAGDSLWIGYGGGLGRLDLPTQKLTSFMPSLIDGSQQPIQGQPIANIQFGRNGDLLTQVSREDLKYLTDQNAWRSVPRPPEGAISCYAADRDRFVYGVSIGLTEMHIETKTNNPSATNQIITNKIFVRFEEEYRLLAEIRTNAMGRRITYRSPDSGKSLAGLEIYDFKTHLWHEILDADAILNGPTAMVLDGQDLWIGGGGYIALVDLKEGKVRKFCHISAQSVQHIAVASGYVWAQFDWHLHRALLSGL